MFHIGIRPETIAEFVDIYKMDYEMFNYRKPAVLIDVGESLLAAWKQRITTSRQLIMFVATNTKKGR